MDPNQLLKMAKRACRAMPDNANAWYMQAKAYERMGEFDEALRNLDVAKEKAKSQELKDGLDNEIESFRRLVQQQQQR